jgi:CHAT domain-containing protein
MDKFIVSILLLFFFNLCYQNAEAQGNTTRFSDRAKDLYEKGNYSEIIPYANTKIEELLNEQDLDSLEISKLYMHQTAAYYKLRENKKSIEISKKGLAYCPNTDQGKNTEAGILYWRSFPEFFLNKPYASYESKKSAVELLKTIENPDLEFLTGAYAELSLDMAFMGYLDKAFNYIEKAIETNKVKNENARHNNNYSLDEDLKLWLLFKKAQVINKKINLKYSEEDQNEIKNTLEKYNQFIKQNPDYWPDLNRIMYGIIYSYYGNSFLTNSKNYRYPDSALYYYNKATQQFSKEDNPYQYNLVIYNKSRAHETKGDYKKALDIIEKLILDDKNPNSSSYGTYKTELLLKLNKIEEWKKLVYQSIASIHDGRDTLKTDFSNFVPSTSINQTNDILSVAESIEGDYLKKPYFKNLKNRLYGLATEQFKTSYRFSTFNSRLEIYYKKILNANMEIILNNEATDSLAVIKLLNDTENIENRLAWQKFSKSRQMVNLPDVDSIESVEFKIRQKLVEAKQNKNTKKVDSLLEELNQHINRIEMSNPQYSNFVKASFDAKKFQSKINQDEVILKYSFFRDQFAIFEIYKEDIKILLKPYGDQERQLIKTHIEQVKERKTSLKQNEELAKLLLPKNISEFNKITIIPDKAIYQLPFETLLYKNKYLVESKSIRYSSHLRFIFLDKNETKEFNKPIVNIFAPDYPDENVFSSTRQGLNYLEGAQKEAKAISKIFDATAFIGSKATKQKFLDHKSDGTIMHLAMHATMNSIIPDLSHFNFPNNEKLHIEELYALNLPLDLAVLGACNTAAGKEDNTLNINSLHRAFNYAGTSATIASLWEVPDKSSSQIMISFYEHLSQNKSKSEALQLAKSDYLKSAKSPKLKHPYYWAGFVLYGSDTPVADSTQNWTWILLISIFILSVLFIIYKSKVKKRQSTN